ncbi:MAG: hypothetical protein AABX11_05985 [Nanoarchaeota archaeon]
MDIKSFNTPILLMGFNRPESIRKVLAEVRKARPKQIFLAVDGPRTKEEEKKVKQVRDIAKEIDWPCKINTLFQKKNLGCRNGGITAIKWFFDNVEEGIILEDDAIPTPDFFRFCAEMLEKYRHDNRIMHVSGCNFQRGWQRERYSYYFSSYTYMWGFATWRRARKKYDPEAKLYPHLKSKGYIRDLFPNFFERKHMERILNTAYYNNNDAPDTEWLYSVFINSGLSIVPNKNLINYIGFTEDSAHTKSEDSFLYQPPSVIAFPLKHPPFIIKDIVADRRYVIWLLLNKIKKYLFFKTGICKLFFK